MTALERPIVVRDSDGFVLEISELVPDGKISAIRIRKDDGPAERIERQTNESPKGLLERAVQQAREQDVWRLAVVGWDSESDSQIIPAGGFWKTFFWG